MKITNVVLTVAGQELTDRLADNARKNIKASPVLEPSDETIELGERTDSAGNVVARKIEVADSSLTHEKLKDWTRFVFDEDYFTTRKIGSNTTLVTLNPEFADKLRSL